MGNNISLERPRRPQRTDTAWNVYVPKQGPKQDESLQSPNQGEHGQTLVALEHRTQSYVLMQENLARRKQEIDEEVRRYSRGTAKRKSSNCVETTLPPLLQPYSQPECLRNQPWIDQALQKYFAHDVPVFWAGLDMQQQVGMTEDMYTQWMRHEAMVDPAVYCVQALGAAFNAMPASPQNWNRVTWLKVQTIQQINLSLSGQVLRTTSLLAVLFFACFEAWNGSPDVARNVHVPGLRRMLEVAGGEHEVLKDVPEFMRRQIRWYDGSVARICGTEAVFEPLPCMSDIAENWARRKDAQGMWEFASE